MKINPLEVIEAVLGFDDHRSSDKNPSISTSELIGPKYKAWKSLSNAKKIHKLLPMKRRSSTLGTGYHMRAEQAMKTYENTLTEVYSERLVSGVTVSGTFDLAIQDDDFLYTIGDHKTGYGGKFKDPQKTTNQLSVYRWLNQDDIDIADRAYIYFVSQSNNAYETIAVDLQPLEDTEAFIKYRLKEIKQEPLIIDCHEETRFNLCDWCEFECNFRKGGK